MARVFAGTSRVARSDSRRRTIPSARAISRHLSPRYAINAYLAAIHVRGNEAGLPIRPPEGRSTTDCPPMRQPPGRSYMSGSTCYENWLCEIPKCFTGGVLFVFRDAIRSLVGSRDRRNPGSGGQRAAADPGPLDAIRRCRIPGVTHRFGGYHGDSIHRRLCVWRDPLRMPRIATSNAELPLSRLPGR